jgi:hypothetical protein
MDGKLLNRTFPLQNVKCFEKWNVHFDGHSFCSFFFLVIFVDEYHEKNDKVLPCFMWLTSS